jgi:predicted AlkP superfamily phosphohydrolase/phosphomutase
MFVKENGISAGGGNSSGPLVILGFDSGDPQLLQHWAKEGYLPTVSSLMRRGCWSQTTSNELLLEHGAWLSIFSGVSRADHGYYYFRQLVPGSYELRLTYGPEIQALPFWGELGRSNKRVVVADVHDMRPIADLAGAQIANWAVHRGYVSRALPDQPKSVPKELLKEITKKFGAPQQIIEDPKADHARNRRFYRDLLARVKRKGALCRYLIEREKPDVLVVSFGESHTAGHQFWKYRSENVNEFGSAIRDVYQAIDREMGVLLSQMPQSANVFVLSSIGLADHYPTGALMTAFCRELGYQAPPRPGPKSFGPMSIARRIVPETWRVALSRRLSRETREQLFGQQFPVSTDWSKTTAFALPSMYTGFLRVNLRGREPQGTIEPGAEYLAILQSLENDLRQLIDPKTGQAAIEKVVRTSEVYDCSYPEVLPDLIVHWKSCSYFIDRVVHPKADLRQEKPEFMRGSEHTINGFFTAAGPAIQARGQIADVEVLELAPTFLKLIGEEKPRRMKGEAIRELFEPAAAVL